MKHLVETTGSFMLIDPHNQDPIHSDRPTVIKSTNFIEWRVSLGHLKILAADLPDEATDAEFVEYWKENSEIAVDAFMSNFDSDKSGEFEEAVSLLEQEDFQVDGRPKVGALNKLLSSKITADERDALWTSYNVV